MGLCLWDITQCSEKFESIVRRFFAKQKETKSIFGRIKKFIKAWRSDGYYDAIALESLLKEAFGDRRMFGNLQLSGKKVAVIATSILTNQAHVFANYKVHETGFGILYSLLLLFY